MPFIVVFTLFLAFAAEAQQTRGTPSERRSAVAATAANSTTARSNSLPKKRISDPLALQAVSFLPAVTYVTGASSTSTGSLAVADVNGDGIPDLVVTNVEGTQDSVGVLLGNGDGTFQPPILNTTVSTIGLFNALAVADVNGDGKLDLIVAACCASNGNNEAAVLLGNGDGTFQSPGFYDLGGTTSSSIVLADVTGNGTLDIISANFNSADNSTVTVLLGNGNGTFQSPIASPAPLDAACLTVADVNGDGVPDALVCSEDSIAVLLGNGNGTFQSFSNSNFYTGFCIDAAAVADLNGDGIPDIVAPNAGADGCGTQDFAGVLLGKGNDTFQSEMNYAATTNIDESVGDVALADVNGDGRLDAIVTSGFNFGSTLSEVAVLLGNGDGTFQLPMLFSTGASRSIPVVVSDLNGDGKPDIVTGNLESAGASVLLNNTQSNRTPTSVTLTASPDPSTYGQKVTFTAMVTSSGGSVPTGRVSFTYGSYSIGGASLNSAGVATLTIGALNADTYPLTAVYKGDANNLGSTSPIVSEVISQATSSVTLTSSSNPSNSGEAVMFTAKISSPTAKPRGPVTFTAGNTTLGIVELSDGKATLTTSSLPSGTSPVTASFAGDSDIRGSSATVNQIVQ